MKNINLNFLLILLFISSCTNYEYNDKKITHINEKSFKTTDTVQTKSWNITSRLYQPLLIESIKNNLFVNDIKNDSGLLHVLNKKDQSYKKCIGNRGRGKNELIGIWRIKKNQNQLFTYDLTLGKMIRYNTNVLNETISTKEYFLKKEQLPNMYDFDFINDSIIVCSAMHSKKRLTFINLNENKVIKRKGHFPIKFNKKYHENVLSTLFRPEIRTNKERIILAGFRTNIIEIYDFNGARIKSITFLDKKIPEFNTVQKGGTSHYKSINGVYRAFLDVVLTKKYFYVLYSGKKSSSQNYWSKKLYQFDLNGNPIKKYVFDRNVAKIIFSDMNNKFYGISVDSKTGKSDIVSFNLKP